jgi:FlaA1/EpsC-like NDP-sugar epimerase
LLHRLAMATATRLGDGVWPDPSPAPSDDAASAARASGRVLAARAARGSLDIALAILSASVAWWLVGNGSPARAISREWLIFLGLVAPIRASCFWVFGVYEGVWRYTGVREVRTIALAVGAGSIGLAAAGTALDLDPGARLPLFVVDALTLVFLMGTVRTVPRPWWRRPPAAPRRRVLIYGAGDAGAMIVRDMVYRSDSRYEPIGIIDDDPAKHGLRIHGVKVQGGREMLARAAAEADEVLVAMPSAGLATLRVIVAALGPCEVPIKTLPRIHELPECRVELAQIRPLALEDLLRRPIVGLDSRPVRDLVQGRCVLVTGAGGSIGSELCRQLLGWKPAKLVLLERNENALFWLNGELAERRSAETALVPALVDVTDEAGTARTFASLRPDIVFHAAAHKHVPMLEGQATEAFRNNVLGTLTTARAAEAYGVERFVLISTDKAVDPTSVMGATKRLCELVVQTVMRDSPTRFCAVRFGNVLGSSGSVTEIFLRQIKTGGPVTVTHPRAHRHFMVISEAVELVTHAATLAERGAVYVLDMGDSIAIVDLARQLIRLAGHRPDVDVPVVFTGLRPGERLHESLVDDTERTIASETKGLFRIVPEVLPDAGRLARHLAHLDHRVRSGGEPPSLENLIEVIPRADPVCGRLAV